MGYMVQCSSGSIMSDNPSKKIRLDISNKNDGIPVSDDLWGQDDLTAEEFDMLEIQATQSCSHNVTYLNNTLPNKTSSGQNNSIKVDDLKQLQYELEGRIKLLSHSLEKSARELNEERLNREHIIKERIKEFYERESNLQKEVEKMHSILEFKEQEMKSTYSKLHIMKSQLQDKKGSTTEKSVNKNFDGAKSSRCGLAELSVKSNFSQKFNRKHKLLVDSPKGEIRGIDILSSILCSRFTTPSFSNFESILNTGDFTCNFDLTPISVVHLQNEQKCDELLEYYSCFLRNHVNMLKATASRCNPVNSNKSSSLTTKWKETGYSQTVLSHLCDIAYIYSFPASYTIHKQSSTSHENLLENIPIQRAEEVLSSKDYLIGEKANTVLSLLLESLTALTNPRTYPSEYLKNEEMEFSLSALFNICLSCPEKFMELIGELPIYSFLNPHESVACLCTALKLVTAVSCCENFIPHLSHKNSSCLLCLLATFLLNVVPDYPEKFAVSVVLVEDLLSSIFFNHNLTEAQLQACECISEVIQGIIKSVLKYYQVSEKINLSTEIIRKGFLLLHFISSCLPNFKDRRNAVEDEYISLISGILAVSKENSELREFYDLIHSLWDFQTDITEFDLDELSEETQTSANEINIK